jgi:hypothetical protein
MTWSALVACAVLSSTPEPAKRFNAEPVGLMIAGVVELTLGGVLLGLADRDYGALDRIQVPNPPDPAEAVRLLVLADDLRHQGKVKTGVGLGLVGTGAAFLVGGVLWFLLEGPGTAVVSVVPVRDGLMAGLTLRF